MNFVLKSIANIVLLGTMFVGTALFAVCKTQKKAPTSQPLEISFNPVKGSTTSSVVVTVIDPTPNCVDTGVPGFDSLDIRVENCTATFVSGDQKLEIGQALVCTNGVGKTEIESGIAACAFTPGQTLTVSVVCTDLEGVTIASDNVIYTCQ